MSSHEKIRVRDVMASTYVMIDGLTTVREGIQLARSHEVKALVVNKRNEDDEFGLVLMNDIAKKCWQRIARLIGSIFMRL